LTTSSAGSARAAPKPPPPLGSADAAHRYLNRDLSWIDFDRRVLELASDKRLRLLERVRLCAIVSSNLDEFFAVRVGRLSRRLAAGDRRRAPNGQDPAETLHDIHVAALALQASQDELWLRDLQQSLAAEGVEVVRVEDVTRRDRIALRERFKREIEPLLTPIAVGRTAPLFPQIVSLALSVGLLVRDEHSGVARLVRVNVPDGVPRFLDVGGHRRVPVEDLIIHHLPMVLEGAVIEAAAPFRITRSADVDLGDDPEDLVEAVEGQLVRRRFADIVRLEVAAASQIELVEALTAALAVGPEQVYPSGAPLGLAALAELAWIDRPDLENPTWRPVTPRPFLVRTAADLLARIRRRDILVHHPYESFETSVQAFVEAARDSKVAALKATVYRTGHPSPTLASLVETAEEKKQAVCLVELKARFDERRNIDWSRALERAGVHVAHGTRDAKVHSKLTLLVRHEKKGPRRYVHVGTGNYHVSNAAVYEDVSLFTADEDIGADVAQVFNALTGASWPAGFRKLLVSPWFLREGLLREIGDVVSAVENGEPGRIRLKVNALADPELVDALYAASSAGVEIEIIVRGICILRPGVPNLSERIRVRSVLGRFLEHSRILSFQAGDRMRVWLGSADLMPRNLDRRVETLVPVEDSRLRAELSMILDSLLADTSSSWELLADDRWHRIVPRPGDEDFSAQQAFMHRATRRSRKHRSRARQ
jgi:polyphosphate kinase